jgi:uncharacterized membrane protein YsdA (DUF1294 family)
LTLSVLGAVLLWTVLKLPLSWPFGLACRLVAVNATTFCYYGLDKARARSAAPRVPEAVLHGLAVVGGSPAAFAAMAAFRHKTLKGSFRLFYWCIVAAQAGLLAWLLKVYWSA